MVTVRTYVRLIDALLAKSLLDDYEIFCALFDVNAHLYGRGPFAMPVRLCVAEEQAEHAIHILAGNLDNISEIPVMSQILRDPAGARNAWELVALAVWSFLPGWCFVHLRYPGPTEYTSHLPSEQAAVAVAHLLGWLAIAAAISLTIVFFHLWRLHLRELT